MQAEQYCQQAFAVNQRAGNDDGLMSVLTTYAGLLSLIGKTEKAAPQYQQVLELSQTHKAIGHELQARMGWGSLLRTQGRLYESEAS